MYGSYVSVVLRRGSNKGRVTYGLHETLFYEGPVIISNLHAKFACLLAYLPEIFSGGP